MAPYAGPRTAFATSWTREGAQRRESRPFAAPTRSGGLPRMGGLGGTEGVCQIGALCEPHRVDDAHPAIGQGPYRHAVTLALLALALVVRLRPRFLEGRLPGKLIQHIAEGLDAGIAPMGLGVVPARIGHRRGTRQRLHTGRAPIPLPVVAPSCQEPGRETRAGSPETQKDRAVRMAQKKVGDLLIVLLDLLQQWRQLADQRYHEARLGA